ncbi:WD40 repeat-like protein [Suillus brevipes Sb2]|jgi:WD40 repeat protein|nr:WD40 repeat-like protein [Suillus brevipes Sb2]
MSYTFNVEPQPVLLGHTGCVLSVAISPDVHRLVSGSQDKTIRMWDMGTGELLGAPWRDCNSIVSGSEDNTIRVWDIDFLNRH